MRFQDFPRQLEEFYVGRMRKTYGEREKRIAAIRTPAAASRYRARVRKAVAVAFGVLPPRTPLQARTWRVSEHGEYRIEGVTFESRPGFWVTATLYLPAERNGRVPAVLFPCGHAANGKAYPLYVAACIRLVREGYAVLIYDPINQGERELYSLLDTGGRLSRNNNCEGHNIIGRQLQACGDWLGTWRMWDGIRALDYLVARPEVDKTRLGITGQSGGGTLSAFIWAMDRRLGAVASGCWCTSYLNDIENSMPADEEQYPPGFLAAGLDKIDLFLARAGEPVLLLGQEFDFFDDRGLRRGYAELNRLHGLLGGGSDTCRLSLDTDTHSYSERNQLAMLAFFNRVFAKSAPAPQRLPVPHEERELQVTPEGDVCRAGSRPMHELVAEQARRIAAGCAPVLAVELPEIIRRALVVPELPGVPHHRRLFQTATMRACTGQQIHRFIVETGPGVICVLRHVCRVGTPFRMNPGPRTFLYLPNLDSQQDLARADTMSGEDDFWALDVRGLGEELFSADDPYALYGHDYMLAGHAVLYGETLLGGRLADVLRTVCLLRAEGAREIHLVGHKQGAVLALLAAALDPTVASVASQGAPESFLALASAPFTFWPAVNFPRGVLRAFDLPAVREALGPRLAVDTRSVPVDFADPVAP